LIAVVTRDFIGYGANPPKVEWPGGALLAVNIAVNFEEGAEWCIEYGDPSCETCTSRISTSMGAAPGSGVCWGSFASTR
jgi:allantoinase